MELNDDSCCVAGSALLRKRPQDAFCETSKLAGAENASKETPAFSQDARKTKTIRSACGEIQRMFLSANERLNMLFVANVKNWELVSRHSHIYCNCCTRLEGRMASSLVKDACGCDFLGQSDFACPFREALWIMRELLHQLHGSDQDLPDRERIDMYKRLVIQKYSCSLRDLNSDVPLALTLAKQRHDPFYSQTEVTIDELGAYTPTRSTAFQAGGYSW